MNVSWTVRIFGLVALFAMSRGGVAEIIPPEHRAPWQGNVGVPYPGGVPKRTVIYRSLGTPGEPSTYVQSVTAADINAALAQCPPSQIVYLNPGTYKISDGPINFTQSWITLRGAGPDQTKLIFSGFDGWAYVNLKGNGLSYPDTIVNWTAGYSQGNRLLTIDSTSGLNVGDLVAVDQENDPDIIDPCGDSSVPCTGGLGNDTTKQHAQIQLLEVTAIQGKQVTVSPGLYMGNWKSSLHPRFMRWSWAPIQGSGIEDMHMEGAYPDTACLHMIDLTKAKNCWIKNVDFQFARTTQIYLNTSKNCEVRHCYFRANRIIGVGSYSLLCSLAAQALIEDNIFDGGSTGVGALITEQGTAGSVIAYNFVHHTSNGNNTGAIFANHNAYPYMNLFEGNIAPQIGGDSYSGNGGYLTLFRNWIKGTDGPGGAGPNGITTGNAHCILFAKSSRYCSAVGNVLGTVGVTNSYEQSAVADGTDQSVYKLGFSSTYWGNPPDPMVVSTFLRHGNYDVVSKAVKWDDSIDDHNLPNSYYYSSKPSFFGKLAWPPINPSAGVPPDDRVIPAGYRFATGTDPVASGELAAPQNLHVTQ